MTDRWCSGQRSECSKPYTHAGHLITHPKPTERGGPVTAAECGHVAIGRWVDSVGDALWACLDCRTRFYPHGPLSKRGCPGPHDEARQPLLAALTVEIVREAMSRAGVATDGHDTLFGGVPDAVAERLRRSLRRGLARKLRAAINVDAATGELGESEGARLARGEAVVTWGDKVLTREGQWVDRTAATGGGE